MERASRERDRPRPERLDLLLSITAIALMAGTATVLADPAIDFVIFDRSVDVAVSSLAALGSAGLAALALVRFRESGRVASLYQSSAFLLLAAVGGATILIVLIKLDSRLGLSVVQPDQLPLYLSMATRLGVSALLLAGGVAAVRAHRSEVSVRHLLLGPVVVIASLAVALYPIRDLLPTLIEEDGIRSLLSDPQIAGRLPGVSTLAVLLSAAAAFALLVAAFLYRWSYLRRRGPVTDAFLAIGLVIAAFAEVHFVLYPGVYTGLVTTGDALRLCFILVLLVGIDAEARSDLRALRSAYAALDRLRVTEAERAALEERSRLAREIHDGLAQHLWFAKLKHERLAPLVQGEASELSSEVGQALDAAIVEARQALVTMRTALDQELPFSDLLARTIDDFGQRSGLRVAFSASSLPPSVPPRQQAELMRVVQEALTNVRKHADATVVRVTAETEEGDLVLTVSDNGRGFRPEEVRGAGLGLRGMAERARILGGHLRILSAPSDGTLVRLRLPLGSIGDPRSEARVEGVVPAAAEGSAAGEDVRQTAGGVQAVVGQRE
jgi:signal transduction histidine kinase